MALTPTQFLIVMLLLTAAVAVSRRMYFRRQQHRFSKIARDWQMHYAAGDRLRLAARVAENLPVPGACDVRVRDVMFRTTGHLHQYLFTIEYGTGAIRGKQRHLRVGAFAEPVTRGVASASPCKLLLAPKNLGIRSQYENLFNSLPS